jgi:hypothetical protein
MSKRFIWIGLLLFLGLLSFWVCKKANTGQTIVVPDVIGPTLEDTTKVLDASDSAYVDIVAIPRPPFEVYFLDQFNRPQDNGTAGKTYTATVYVLDNTAKKLNGPYTGSTFPNSISNSDNKTNSNTVKMNTAETTVYLFNNLAGHKGGTLKGLNLVDANEKRYTPGFDPDSVDVTCQYINVHRGMSDNGNFNSRGSRGCLTVLPKDTTAFFGNFNFANGTTGTSNGVISVVRSSSDVIEQLIKDLQNVYN